MKTYEFDGTDLHIDLMTPTNIHCQRQAIGVYWVEKYTLRGGSEIQVAVFDDFGDMVRVNLESARQRAQFKQNLH